MKKKNNDINIAVKAVLFILFIVLTKCCLGLFGFISEPKITTFTYQEPQDMKFTD